MLTLCRNNFIALMSALLLAGCQSTWFRSADTRHQLIISVSEQRMHVLEDGKEVASYPVSTAKRGVGDMPDSYMTPGGRMQVAEKFGDGMPMGTVFKDRKPTGEIVAVDAPGRDPVVTRIFWLRGLEERNRNAYPRFIYIHGTPQESLLGTPASFGCIRMRSVDIAELYERVGTGAQVDVIETPFVASLL
ncbi:L,D-transpeptidase [Undibacterium sp. CY18W]|uniref:L,D-transpeptidase n=1 Tax=Undibacterium hunanense TaxID=2762292 RepID=A0ABR6ZSM9_9BURK|nr:L,D-transpeptidase [Undibacterium hunanense]MBC3918875.1 L,D-transpeptidase [Undibacterium hunanense]